MNVGRHNLLHVKLDDLLEGYAVDLRHPTFLMHARRAQPRAEVFVHPSRLAVEVECTDPHVDLLSRGVLSCSTHQFCSHPVIDRIEQADRCLTDKTTQKHVDCVLPAFVLKIVDVQPLSRLTDVGKHSCERTLARPREGRLESACAGIDLGKGVPIVGPEHVVSRPKVRQRLLLAMLSQEYFKHHL